MPSDRPDLLTAKEAARLLRVAPSTVRRWAGLGLLPVIRLPSGALRFRRSDVERLLGTVEGEQERR